MTDGVLNRPLRSSLAYKTPVRVYQVIMNVCWGLCWGLFDLICHQCYASISTSRWIYLFIHGFLFLVWQWWSTIIWIPATLLLGLVWDSGSIMLGSAFNVYWQQVRRNDSDSSKLSFGGIFWCCMCISLPVLRLFSGVRVTVFSFVVLLLADSKCVSKR